MRQPYESILPFKYAPGQAPPVTRVRSTLLAASLQGIRGMGWEASYFAALPAELHTEMQMLTAGIWVPLSLAMAHYTACDAMQLTVVQMNAIGEEVSLRTQKSFVGVLGKAVSGAGATPWYLYQNTHRIWARMLEGADTAVFKVGPKEALIVLVGCPLIELQYFRVGLMAYYRALSLLFTRVAYTRESPEHRGRNAYGFRIAWA